MECLGSQCLLDWLKRQVSGEGPSGPIPSIGMAATASAAVAAAASTAGPARQGSLWTSSPYQEDAPAIRSRAEWAGAVEHLDYALFRRYGNQLTRAERTRLDNTIENVLFKMDRYLGRLEGDERSAAEREVGSARDSARAGKERIERLRYQARRAEAKLAQLATLTPEGFEEFVGELFEAMGYEVEVVGGSGDEGADLRVKKGGLLAIVQCKYHKKGVVGSPELQKFLGTVHHTRSHKGFYVTTRTFTLSAERFVADNPIELIDGPRLVELVQETIGPGAGKEQEPTWF